MGRISDEDVERVRSASDLVEIASERLILKQKGRNFWCCCPFHDEKSPSMQIRPDLNLWHCFGCGEGGDVFDFVQRIENIDFPDTVRLLAERAHIEIVETQGGAQLPRGHKERLIALCEETASFYHATLMRSTSEAAGKARTYLSTRGFGSSVSKAWMLGFAPGRGALVAHLRSKGFTADEMVDANVALRYDKGQLRDRFYDRVMFPIRDRQGRTIAFGGRIVAGESNAKYINSSDTLIFHKSSTLFGFDQAKGAICAEASVIVVEGYTDVIALHEVGVKNVVATLGTALTAQHVKTLRSMRPRKVIYLFDGDNAGQKAADRAVEFIDRGITPESGSDYLEFLVTVLPDGMDPAEFAAARGKEGIDEVIAVSRPLIRFAIDRRLAAWDLKSPEQRARALSSAVTLLAPIKESIIAADYANYIADALACDLSLVQKALQAVRPQQANPKAEEVMPKPVGAGRQLVQRQSQIAENKRALKAQTEALSLIARFPELVGLLTRTQGKLAWSDGFVQKLVAAFMEVPAGASPAELVAFVDTRVEGAAAYLSAGSIEADSAEDAKAKVVGLFCDIKEEELLKSIRLGNARLKNPAEMTQKEYDNVFVKVSALQKELNELRKARTGQNDPQS